MSKSVQTYQICWKVGIRKRQDGILSTDTPFLLLPNPWYGWAADPFLFEKNGVVYIFAEVWNYFRQRGSIAFCRYEKGKTTPWKIVISEWHHMSYPFIWEDEKGIHICAETNEAKKIYTYKAIDFPLKWKKEKVIALNGKYADTTFLLGEGNPQYLFTYAIDEKNNGMLLRAKLNLDMSLEGKMDVITRDAKIARPGGNFLMESGILYRVAQNCSIRYGESLIFCRVMDNSRHYAEKEEFEKRYEEIQMEPETDCIGMHTYNRSEHYEVVDFRIVSFHFWDYIFSKVIKLRNFIGRNVLKVIRLLIRVFRKN